MFLISPADKVNFHTMFSTALCLFNADLSSGCLGTSGVCGLCLESIALHPVIPSMTDIPSDILLDILSDIYSDILSAIFSGIRSGIFSGILSDIYFDIPTDILFWHSLSSGPAGTTLTRRLLFGSGGDHCDVALAVEVWQEPL